MSARAAVLARMEAVVDPTYDGEVPVDKKGRPLEQRYAVLYATPGQRATDDFTRTQADRHVFRWQVTSVGGTAEQAEWVAVRCRDALMDERLRVEGWETGVVEHRSSSDIRPDEDIPGQTLFVAVDNYSLTATR